MLTEVLHQNDHLACRLIHEHTGQEIDKIDGYLVILERPVQAAAFALAYPRGLRDFASEAGQALRAPSARSWPGRTAPKTSPAAPSRSKPRAGQAARCLSAPNLGLRPVLSSVARFRA
jgi:hypothetical protein